jgi:hypothetical protein
LGDEEMSIIKLAASQTSVKRFVELLERNTPKKLHKLIDKAPSPGAIGDLIKKHAPIELRSRISRIMNKHILSDHTANHFRQNAINHGDYKTALHGFKEMQQNIHHIDNHMMANAGKDWEKHLERKK